MNAFLRSLSLLIAAVASLITVCHVFNVPINLTTILNLGNGVVNTGNGVVNTGSGADIRNEVNQGAPAPSPSPATPAAPAPTPEAPPKVSQGAPPSEPTRPEVAVGEGQPEPVAPEPATIRRRSPRVTTYEPVYEEQPQPVNADYAEQPVPRRSCPTVVVRRSVPPPSDEDTEPWPQPSNNGGSYSRSSSRSVVTVNGRVVSSSSVTVVNGRVVSRSVYPPPSSEDDDDQW